MNHSITSTLPRKCQDINRSLGPHHRLQLATVNKNVYFGVKTIAPPPSKPTIIFSLNEGDDKISLLVMKHIKRGEFLFVHKARSDR
jgi:hypothetical protein